MSLAGPTGASLPAPQSEQPLVRFGDFYLTEHWVVTPQGSVPLAHCQIFVTNNTRVDRVIPTWAIVVAIVGLFVITLFSLLFLLAKEDRVSGFAQITITNGSFTHQTGEPAQFNPAAQFSELESRATYARALIARA
ncbi:hypothetical protein [Herbiconiux ginsengi]|uniref:Uncharacterized protein n=1 Tax=Herbiconiux ginsengi TaxID=381665 RepID=A0A1H3TWM3_9MICO|nr:hypothetical protein [Herbiconiux ginsengi]SDZ54620.1 hypothetical protein SAMN05216554_4557 [Herbiconiux ginsengi]